MRAIKASHTGTGTGDIIQFLSVLGDNPSGTLNFYMKKAKIIKNEK